MASSYTPIIYPLADVPARLQLVIDLNPMTGIVEIFRHALLGSTVNSWVIGESAVVTIAVLVLGLFLFRRMERRFADVI